MIDLEVAKSVFQVHEVNAAGQVVSCVFQSCGRISYGSVRLYRTISTGGGSVAAFTVTWPILRACTDGGLHNAARSPI